MFSKRCYVNTTYQHPIVVEQPLWARYGCGIAIFVKCDLDTKIPEKFPAQLRYPVLNCKIYSDVSPKRLIVRI